MKGGSRQVARSRVAMARRQSMASSPRASMNASESRGEQPSSRWTSTRWVGGLWGPPHPCRSGAMTRKTGARCSDQQSQACLFAVIP